ncbi:MAG: hypothetical protein ACE5EA_03820 [Nitrospirota bacterium]
MNIFNDIWSFVKSHKILSAIIILLVPVPGYIMVDKAVFMLEKDNEFCIACHLI